MVLDLIPAGTETVQSVSGKIQFLAVDRRVLAELDPADVFVRFFTDALSNFGIKKPEADPQPPALVDTGI